MLSKNDKKWLVEEIEKAVVKALTVEIQWEKVRDEATGLPLASREMKTEDVFLPSFFVQHLKYHEGAFRGLQETVDMVKNSNADGLEKLQALGEFLIALEPMMRSKVESDSERRHDSQAVITDGDGDRAITSQGGA